MFFQVVSVLLMTVANILSSIAAKVAFSTPPVNATLGGTKWAFSVSATPLP